MTDNDVQNDQDETESRVLSDRRATRGGLRRLRSGQLDKPQSDANQILSRAQFIGLLADEINSAKREDQSVLVAAMRIRPLPEGYEDQVGRQQVPLEVVSRFRSVNPSIRILAADRQNLLLFLPSLRRRPDGEAVVKELVRAFSSPVEMGNLQHYLVPTIGAALMDHESHSAEALIDGARLALGECDSLNPSTMFHPYQRVRRKRQGEMKDALRQAVLNREIQVALQPAFDVVNDRLQAVEALARWNRPNGGPVPPVEFIPLAKDIGVSHMLAKQVLDAAVAMIVEARSHHPAMTQPVTVWLNVTPDEVLHPEFADLVLGAAAGRESMPIGIELSPSPDAESRQIHQLLKSLASQNVRVAVGDFGIGHANLNILQQLPFDSVKLDRALVRQIAGNDEAATMVGHLVKLADALGLETTAQGVETEDQLKVVSDLGCKLAQGYHLASPTSDPEAVERWFRLGPDVTPADRALPDEAQRQGKDAALRAVVADPNEPSTISDDRKVKP